MPVHDPKRQKRQKTATYFLTPADAGSKNFFKTFPPLFHPFPPLRSADPEGVIWIFTQMPMKVGS